MEMIGHIARIVKVIEIGQAIAIFGSRTLMQMVTATEEEEGRDGTERNNDKR